MIRMIKWGGRPSLRTVAICAGLMVFNAASASSRAGFAASNFSSAYAFSSAIFATSASAFSLTICT